LPHFDGKEPVEVPEVVPNPLPNAGVLMVADLCGDFRDELVVALPGEGGNPAVAILTATEPIDKKYRAAWTDLDYHLWTGHNMGGGYRSIYDRVLK